MFLRSLKIMMLLLLSLSSYSVMADEQSVIFNQNVGIQDSQIASERLVLLALDGGDSAIAAPQTEQPLVEQIDNFNFVNDARRVVSSDNRAGVGRTPNYFLLVAFMEPVFLHSFTTSVDTPKFVDHWTSQISSSISRVSGWKDGNSLYSHHHTRFV
ncbi:hypothetical protein [Shewanella donghaensis]|uniref:hypothetical protein n=1 Tax=Shewanella donghaensis TaxID=238836 RepID=UPI00131524AC|nr:hypothetical protein [Shewanella donghaensis]